MIVQLVAEMAGSNPITKSHSKKCHIHSLATGAVTTKPEKPQKKFDALNSLADGMRQLKFPYNIIF